MTRKYRYKQVKKYKLEEELQLLINGQLRYMKLKDWIRLYPEVLYYHMYLPGKLELVKVSIVKSAFVEFKKSLAKLFPDLFRQMIMKQLNTNNYSN